MTNKIILTLRLHAGRYDQIPPLMPTAYLTPGSLAHKFALEHNDIFHYNHIFLREIRKSLRHKIYFSLEKVDNDRKLQMYKLITGYDAT